MAATTPVYENIRKLDAFAREQLPKLNLAAENDRLAPVEFISTVGGTIGPVLAELNVTPPESIQLARRAVQLVGMIASSAERHGQARGWAAGDALKGMGNAESLLLKLAPVAKHPPRDSQHTYWLWNREPIYVFVDRDEYWFNFITRETDALFHEAIVALRPIACGDIALDEGECAERLISAATSMRGIKMCLQKFAEKATTGQANMTPDYFMRRFRTYLVSYPIGDTPWGGVNAANLPSALKFDFVAGLVNKSYIETVEKRLRYMPAEDADELSHDMRSTSVGERFVEAIPERGIDACSVEADRLRPSIRAFVQLGEAVSSYTAYHWSLISNYLIKPSAQLTTSEINNLPVKPTAGTGHASHEETLKIRDMRREHGTVAMLRSLLR